MQTHQDLTNIARHMKTEILKFTIDKYSNSMFSIEKCSLLCLLDMFYKTYPTTRF